MDIIYILGTGSLWSNNEIRYSLRSIERFFEFKNVFIVGEYPRWMKNAIHIPVEDKTKNKQENSRIKLLEACEDERISETFLLMNDDFFFLKKIKNIPCYSRGSLENSIKNHPTKNGYYFDSLVDTKKALQRMGIKNSLDFGVHCPFIVSKSKLKKTLEVSRKENAPALRTLYGNMWNLNSTKTKDFKMTGKKFSKKYIGGKFLSSDNDLIFSQDFREFLQDTYPNISQFENDGGEGIDSTPGTPINGMAVEFLKSGECGCARGDRVIFWGDDQEIAHNYIKKGICKLV